MSLQDSDTSKQICDHCGTAVDVTFTRAIKQNGSPPAIKRVCPTCLSSIGDVSKELADYSPEA